MTVRYLLDTNVLSELIRPVPNRRVSETLHRNERFCAMSAVTLEELTYGAARLAPGTRRTMLTTWIEVLAQRLPVVPFDAEAATWLGRERARLMSEGTPAPRTDGEIAAAAVTRSLTLVTRNTRDFARFKDLKLEDWHRDPPSDH